MGKKKKTETSKADFELFKKYVEKYYNAFGLMRYRLYVSHDDLDNGVWGSCKVHLRDMLAEITFNKHPTGVDLPNKEDIKTCAFHEVCELLMARLSINGSARFVSECDMEEARHEVICLMETTLFPLMEGVSCHKHSRS